MGTRALDSSCVDFYELRRALGGAGPSPGAAAMEQAPPWADALPSQGPAGQESPVPVCPNRESDIGSWGLERTTTPPPPGVPAPAPGQAPPEYSVTFSPPLRWAVHDLCPPWSVPAGVLMCPGVLRGGPSHRSPSAFWVAEGCWRRPEPQAGPLCDLSKGLIALSGSALNGREGWEVLTRSGNS